MPRVLLLLPTTTYRTHAFMEAVQRLGVELTVASEEASTLTRLNPSGLLRLNFDVPQEAARQVVQFAQEYPIAAVVPVDDQVTICAATICQALGLRHNSVESVHAARNKHRMRELLGQAAVPQPRYKLCSLDDDPVHIADQVQYRALSNHSHFLEAGESSAPTRTWSLSERSHDSITFCDRNSASRIPQTAPTASESLRCPPPLDSSWSRTLSPDQRWPWMDCSRAVNSASWLCLTNRILSMDRFLRKLSTSPLRVSLRPSRQTLLAVRPAPVGPSG